MMLLSARVFQPREMRTLMGMNNQSVVYVFVSSIFFQRSGNENEKKISMSMFVLMH